ncbi:MAG: RNA polymerase factor sigma-32 [Deltaproteobacteria bacterium]|jgi:RNA polymerase sigma-32 factor|nr:RNA polymerase factor sigma-32 [Deltaproteobacteria bacterium]
MDRDGETFLPPAVRPASLTPVGRPVPLPPAQRELAQPPAAPSVDSFRAYLNEVKRFKLLSKAEEEELIKRYKRTGDPEAGQRLITGNLRLVVKIAMELHSYWLNNLQDLVQEGNMGLMQALKKFDPTRKVKFSFYAAYWIKAYILRYIMKNWRLVKIGTTQAQRKLFFNLKKEEDRLIKEGLEPCYSLLAERLGVSETEVMEMDSRFKAGREVSLDTPQGEVYGQMQVSLIPSNEETVDNFLADSQIRRMLGEKLALYRETLTPRETTILDKRLLTDDPVTLQELGEEFGVSRERVRQLEEKLKKTLGEYLLRELPEIDFDRLI